MEGQLRQRVRAMLEAHWQPEGYTSPNPTTYPWMWLWDSAFHVLVWAELEDERALVELASIFRWQTDDGFVPHMGYQRDPTAHAGFWGRPGASTITQPPMYGHAISELVRRGVAVPRDLIERGALGLRWFLEHRMRADGRIAICHPWETGCDDCPSWDPWCPGGYERERWRARKGELVDSLIVDEHGAAVGNRSFEAAAAGFDALVAFNLCELGRAAGDEQLLRAGSGVAAAVDETWHPGLRLWGGGTVRTLPAALNVLQSRSDEHVEAVLADLVDPHAFGAPFGPRGVHRQEAVYDPSSYWRGSAWPQLTYLLWWAARLRGAPQAHALAEALVAGAERSSFAEHWHPDTGAPLGARPQSWAGLALLVSAAAS